MAVGRQPTRRGTVRSRLVRALVGGLAVVATGGSLVPSPAVSSADATSMTVAPASTAATDIGEPAELAGEPDEPAGPSSTSPPATSTPDDDTATWIADPGVPDVGSPHADDGEPAGATGTETAGPSDGEPDDADDNEHTDPSEHEENGPLVATLAGVGDLGGFEVAADDAAVPTIAKTVDRSVAAVGSLLTYTIVVVNPTATALTDVTVFDQLGDGLRFESATADPDSVSGQVVAWSGRVVPANGTLAVTLRATVEALGPEASRFNLAAASIGVDTYVAAAEPCALGPLPFPAACVLTSIVAEPPPTLAKRASAVTAMEGSIVTYTLELDNPGNTDITGVVVRDEVPVGLSVDAGSVTPAPTATSPGPPYTMEWGPLVVPAGETATIAYEASLDAGTAGQTLTNVAEATGFDPAQTCPSPGVSGACATVIVTPPPPPTIGKVVDRATATEGDVLEYAIELDNPTAQPLTATVRDIVPDAVQVDIDSSEPAITTTQATGIDGFATVLIWQDVVVPAGGSVTIGYRAAVRDGTVDTTATNMAWAIAPATEELLDSVGNCPAGHLGGEPALPPAGAWACASTDIVAPGDPTFSKTVSSTTATTGSTLTYTIVVTNPTSADLTGVTVGDLPFFGLEYIGGSAVPAPDVVEGPAIGWQDRTVPARGELVFTLQARVVATDFQVPIVNMAVVQVGDDYLFPATPCPPPFAIEPFVGCTFTLLVAPQPTVTKTVDVQTAIERSVVHFEIELDNPTDDPISGVRVDDYLPAGLTFDPTSAQPAASSTAEVAPHALNIVWSGVDVPAHGSTVLRFAATVDAGTEGATLTNHAAAGELAAAGETCTLPELPPIACASITVVAPPPPPTIAKSVDATEADEGDVLTYTIELTNPGSQPVTATLRDIVPDTLDVDLGSASPSAPAPDDTGIDGHGTVLIWEDLAIAGGSTVTVSYEAAVRRGAGGSTLTNLAVASVPADERFFETTGGCPDGHLTAHQAQLPPTHAWACAATEVAEPPPPTISKTVDLATAAVADRVTYTIVLTNPTKLALADVEVRDIVPVGLEVEIASAVPDGASWQPAVDDPATAGVLRWTALTIGANETLTLTFSALVVDDAEPLLVNTALAEIADSVQFAPAPRCAVPTAGFRAGPQLHARQAVGPDVACAIMEVEPAPSPPTLPPATVVTAPVAPGGTAPGTQAPAVSVTTTTSTTEPAALPGSLPSTGSTPVPLLLGTLALAAGSLVIVTVNRRRHGTAP